MKGTLIVPYCPHALISVSFAVIAKNVLEYLVQDATREGLLGRMMRRRQRLIISWTEQYAEWVSMQCYQLHGEARIQYHSF